MAAPSQNDSIIGLMDRFRHGSKEAADELMERLYPELRRLAAARMKGERADHTWQPTALVNELYLELVRIRSLDARDPAAQKERNAFFAFAAHLMKRLLIHHARPLYRKAEKVDLSQPLDAQPPDIGSLAEIEDLLAGLAAMDPKLRTIVEMKVFEELTVDEIAARLGVSPRTIAREWNFARGWLRRQLAGGEQA
jgi:RNA polymerase sigma factor (TIGR02999 family)